MNAAAAAGCAQVSVPTPLTWEIMRKRCPAIKQSPHPLNRSMRLPRSVVQRRRLRFFAKCEKSVCSITMAVKGHKSRYSDLTMVRAVGVPGLATFNCRHNNKHQNLRLQNHTEASTDNAHRYQAVLLQYFYLCFRAVLRVQAQRI